MSSDSIPLLIVFILFVLCGAYFAGAESAFTAMNKIKIKSKADEGDRPGQKTPCTSPITLSGHFPHCSSATM